MAPHLPIIRDASPFFRHLRAFLMGVSLCLTSNFFNILTQDISHINYLYLSTYVPYLIVMKMHYQNLASCCYQGILRNMKRMLLFVWRSWKISWFIIFTDLTLTYKKKYNFFFLFIILKRIKILNKCNSLICLSLDKVKNLQIRYTGLLYPDYIYF